MNAEEVTQFIQQCKSGLTLDGLKRLLHYNPVTGQFTRRIRTAHRIQVGDIAGSLATNGYLYICLPDKKYLAHRLAWFYMTGEMAKEIDHKNGDRVDNRIDNLRPVTRSQNNQNQHVLKSNNTTGVRGVTRDKRRGTFRAQARVAGVNHYFGDYLNLEEAAQAAKKGMALIHTHNELAKQ